MRQWTRRHPRPRRRPSPIARPWPIGLSCQPCRRPSERSSARPTIVEGIRLSAVRDVASDQLFLERSLRPLPRDAGSGRAGGFLAETIGSEPFAWDILVQDQHGERKKQAYSAKQRDRHKRINVGDRRRRGSRKKPCNCSGHVTLQIYGARYPNALSGSNPNSSPAKR